MPIVALKSISDIAEQRSKLAIRRLIRASTGFGEAENCVAEICASVNLRSKSGDSLKAAYVQANHRRFSIAFRLQLSCHCGLHLLIISAPSGRRSYDLSTTIPRATGRNRNVCGEAAADHQSFLQFVFVSCSPATRGNQPRLSS
jgi:hypothetical protein